MQAQMELESQAREQSRQTTAVQEPEVAVPSAKQVVGVRKPVGFSAKLQELFESQASELIADRKKSKAPETYPRRQDLKNFT